MKKNKLNKYLFFFFSFSFLLVQTSCQDNDDTAYVSQENRDNKLAVDWFTLQNQLVKTTPNCPPPVAARTYAYAGITLYQSLYKGMNGKNLQTKIQGLSAIPTGNGTNYVWSIVANSAMAEIELQLFENTSDANKTLITSLETNLLSYYVAANAVTDQELINKSVALGKQIATAIYESSKTDGGHQAYANLFPASFVVPTGQGLWISTAPNYPQHPLLPYWGANRTLVANDAATTFAVNPPPVYSEDTGSVFYSNAMQVYDAVNQLTPEQETIAHYWADDGGTVTPPGHMMAIVLQLIQSEQLDLFESSRIICKVSIGLNDAAIICWRTKYQHNLIRPISYIRAHIDPTWNTIITTPPFPTYTSGHSSFSGTAAGILAGYFGSDFSFSDNSKVVDGFEIRTFSSFQAMSNEAAISRMYGGIHYPFDNQEGLTCGTAIATNVNNLNL